MKFFKNYLNYKVLELLGKFKFKSPLLEIGCGTGETLKLLKKFKAEGIDLSEEAVNECKKNKINARVMNFLRNNKKYNSILCLDVIEHIKDDLVFIKHIKKSLVKGGKVLILVPSGKMMNDDLKYGHYRRYSKDEIKSKLENSGFKIEHIEMFGYPFLYYTRISGNIVIPIKLDYNENLEENTKKSSYESPFDSSFMSKIAKFFNDSSLFLKLLLLQDSFKNGKKGLGVMVVANKI